ncbi:PREDICTED: magnesium-dependent phosphatase 1 isoform X3 [Camelina sativa]|uniref:Magnesium-dependent phosphatase 1 isoform X3 n=1 Tax=Camelina sativa TaxID=90675 RepID=A0ABM1QBV5_CAMSA|nr:PREDICTED: magnesium-dependent phosphatase 1 isoform X3 [Camelina sativa]
MGDEKVKDEAMQIMGMFQILPRLVVFDLDYTLWPFYCECLSKREMPSLYPQAKGILSALKEKGIEMAIASRSPTSDIAITFLDKLNIKPMFVAKEIYSSWTHKTEHFQKIHTRTGVPFTAMLFFDDEDRNIKSVNTNYYFVASLNFMSRGFENGSDKHLGGQWSYAWSIQTRAYYIYSKSEQCREE